MQATPLSAETQRYAKTIEVSKRIRWDIDRDVIRDREFDFDQTSCPTASRSWTSWTFSARASGAF